MKKIILAFAALLTLTAATDCLAARYRGPMPGPYVSGFIGISAPNDTDISSSRPEGEFFDRAQFDPNINVGATAGFDFLPLRLEGELSYKHSEISTVTDQVSGTRFTGVDGRVGALAMLINAWIDVHNYSPITPYVGGGVGFASLHLSDTSGFNNSSGGVETLYLSDDDAVFAYQVGAGLGIELNRQVTLDLGYRFFGTDTATFNGSIIQTSLKMESHNAAIGLRFKF